MLQSDDRTYVVTLDGREFGTGEKTDGWASLGGSHGGAVTVIRNSWQEYPKGFGIDKDGIEVRVWPRSCGRALTFTTPFEEQAVFFNGYPNVTEATRDEEEVKRLLAEKPTAPLNLKSFAIKTEEELAWVEEMLEKHAKGRIISYNDTGTSNGVGTAKTTEIHLRLSPSPVPDSEAAEFAKVVQHPPVGRADPVYACATGAFGQFYHGGDPRFAKTDAGLDDVVRVVAMEPTEICRLYGMMRYGNMVCAHARAAPGLSYLRHKDTDPDKALRYVGPYNNEANDQVMAIWGNFLRTGRREHFFLGLNYSRAIADVAMVHAHPTNQNVVGLMHYHNCHQWSGAPSPSHSLLTGILTGYYLSGDRRLLEVARETADRLVRGQVPAGIISCRNGVLHREFTGPLWSLIEAYRATWEEAYGELAHRSLNWFLRTIPEPGLYPNSVFTRGDRGDEAVVQPPCTPPQCATDKYYLFLAALQLFDNPALRKQIIADADYWVWDAPLDSLSWYCTMACLAYELTGDPTYAAYCKTRIEDCLPKIASECRRYKHINFGTISLGSTVPRLMRVAADAMDRKPKALAKAEEAWRKKRKEAKPRPPPDRPDRGPEVSLGKLSTAPIRRV